MVVRRMNSDWRSAQWQLNDLRSVDSVSINQTALSRSPPFFFFLIFSPSLSPLGSHFSLCLQTPEQGEGALFSLSVSFFLFFCSSTCIFVFFPAFSLTVSFPPFAILLSPSVIHVVACLARKQSLFSIVEGNVVPTLAAVVMSVTLDE